MSLPPHSLLAVCEGRAGWPSRQRLQRATEVLDLVWGRQGVAASWRFPGWGISCSQAVQGTNSAGGHPVRDTPGGLALLARTEMRGDRWPWEWAPGRQRRAGGLADPEGTHTEQLGGTARAHVTVPHKHPPSTSATYGKLVRKEVVFFQRRDWIFESHVFLLAQRKRLALASCAGGRGVSFPFAVTAPQGRETGQAGRQGRGTHAASRMTSNTAPSPLRVCRSLPPLARGWGGCCTAQLPPAETESQSKGPDSGSPLPP